MLTAVPLPMDRSALGSVGQTSRRIPMSKRVFDVMCVLVLMPFVVPIGICVALALKILEGGPVFYVARRVGQGRRDIGAVKFRTMHPNMQDQGVSGGDKNTRITPFCAWLRRRRLDEIPQLINVLRGEMSMVGPRPPDPVYVSLFPELYDDILRSRPGMTGLATLYMHRFEDRFLQQFLSAEETDAAYRRVCIPRKARLDKIYQKRWRQAGGVFFDIAILIKSVSSVLRRS